MATESPFEKMVGEVIKDGLVANYIITVELMTEDGMDLRLITSDTMTPWHALGMLQVATEMIQAVPLGEEKED
jgi:hypothetical protein